MVVLRRDGPRLLGGRHLRRRRRPLRQRGLESAHLGPARRHRRRPRRPGRTDQALHVHAGRQGHIPREIEVRQRYAHTPAGDGDHQGVVLLKVRSPSLLLIAESPRHQTSPLSSDSLQPLGGVYY